MDHITILTASEAPFFSFTTIWVLLNALLSLCITGGLVYLFILLVRALRKYLKSGEVRQETAAVRKSLAAVLKEQRIKNNMTQEFIAEQLGVSRQAVSKWETGASDPSTSNLLALAKLYGISARELLNDVET